MTICHPAERKEIIVARLAVGSKVNCADLASEFSVSEDAIRRDLRSLAAEGLCRRVYGGALPLVTTTPPLNERIGKASDRKSALARAAVDEIARGEVLFIDSGSTNHAVVAALPSDWKLTVVTNSVAIAGAVLDRSDLRLVMIGGIVDPVVGGCVDSVAMAGLSELAFDRCFLGACAVSAAGISAVDYADAAFKRALVEHSRRIHVLATSEKLGASAPYRVATLSDVDVVIVEHDASHQMVAELEQAGANIFRDTAR